MLLQTPEFLALAPLNERNGVLGQPFNGLAAIHVATRSGDMEKIKLVIGSVYYMLHVAIKY